MRKKICVIDTEFNAFDFAGQNDGYQEITEIGAVILSGGKITNRFSCICALYPGHRLTKRCRKITGMTQDRLNGGLPFATAIARLKKFMETGDTNRIYAYGVADSIQLRTTAKLNGLSKEDSLLINSIKDIFPLFRMKLELKYQYSLTDLCRICKVKHDAPGREHSALYDAEDTALAYYNLMRDDIDRTYLEESEKYKADTGIYEKNRSVRHAVAKTALSSDNRFLDQIEEAFCHARDTVSPPVLAALHDDMMCMIGRPDLQTGIRNIQKGES